MDSTYILQNGLQGGCAHCIHVCNVLDSRVGKTHVDDSLQLEHVLYCSTKRGSSHTYHRWAYNEWACSVVRKLVLTKVQYEAY
jgi:hypothetical protein